MKKLYEVPAMEIVRLDASENIAKLPSAGTGEGSTSTSTTGSAVTTTVRTKSLMAEILGAASSNNVDA